MCVIILNDKNDAVRYLSYRYIIEKKFVQPWIIISYLSCRWCTIIKNTTFYIYQLNSEGKNCQTLQFEKLTKTTDKEKKKDMLREYLFLFFVLIICPYVHGGM